MEVLYTFNDISDYLYIKKKKNWVEIHTSEMFVWTTKNETNLELFRTRV
jgi:hypothetical protein